VEQAGRLHVGHPLLVGFFDVYIYLHIANKVNVYKLLLPLHKLIILLSLYTLTYNVLFCGKKSPHSREEKYEIAKSFGGFW
jgi:hypothetical protein